VDSQGQTDGLLRVGVKHKDYDSTELQQIGSGNAEEQASEADACSLPCIASLMERVTKLEAELEQLKTNGGIPLPAPAPAPDGISPAPAPAPHGDGTSTGAQAICRPGAVSRKLAHHLETTSSMGYDACLADCSAKSGCIAFDFTDQTDVCVEKGKGLRGCCNLVKNGSPMGGGENDHRQFCIMLKDSVDTTAIKANPAGDYACALGKQQLAATETPLGQSITTTREGCAEECRQNAQCKGFDVAVLPALLKDTEKGTACRLASSLATSVSRQRDREGLRFFCTLR